MVGASDAAAGASCGVAGGRPISILAGSEDLISLPIRGGINAPRRARRSVLSRLNSHVPQRQASDAALLVSELVTNSVIHAAVGPDRTVLVEVAKRDDRLLIAVTDPGSRLEPRLKHDDRPRHLGLVLVDALSAAWGVERDPVGTTRVWCELMLDPAPRG